MREPATENAARILVVDDDPRILSTCERYLLRLGHEVELAESVEDAHARLVAGRYDVVVTDLQMPGPSGLDLLTLIQTSHPTTRTILMSGRAETADAVAAIERGVDRMLLKPFHLEDLRAAVENALAELRQRERVLKDREMFEAMVRQRATTSKIWILRAAHALATAVEAKDAYTAGHASRVTAYAMTLRGGFEGIDSDAFRLACQLHDLGKIGIPDAILNKPERLTEEESVLVRDHPATGATILGPLIDDPFVISIVRFHHERWDGAGYPDGLNGDQIPLGARILAVADTLDAMSSDRAYRTALPWQVAVDEIRRCAGTQFDPRVVEVFESQLPALEGLHRSFEPVGAPEEPVSRA